MITNVTFWNYRGRSLVSGVTFQLHEGEVLGVAGVDGNGQVELVELLVGLRSPTAGSIRVHDRDTLTLSPVEFFARSGAVIPADRQGAALALDLPLMDNLIMRDVGAVPFERWGFLARGAISEHCAKLAKEYDIRAPNLLVRMSQLSGGNQQKSVVARELHHLPKLLLAAQPTRGLDVGAMEFVYRRLLEHKLRGGATLLISTELDEILSLSDRIAVMVDGRILRILRNEEADPETLGLLLAGEAAHS